MSKREQFALNPVIKLTKYQYEQYIGDGIRITDPKGKSIDYIAEKYDDLFTPEQLRSHESINSARHQLEYLKRSLTGHTDYLEFTPDSIHGLVEILDSICGKLIQIE